MRFKRADSTVTFSRKPSQLVTVAAPLEPDSDDSFGDAPIIKPSKKRGRKPKQDQPLSLQTSPRKGKHKSLARRRTLSTIKKGVVTSKTVSSYVGNPLIEILGEDLGLEGFGSDGDSPASSSSSATADEALDDDESDTDSAPDVLKGHKGKVDWSPPAWAGQARSNGQRQSGIARSNGDIRGSSSETETESELDETPSPPGSAAQKRKGLLTPPRGPGKRMRLHHQTPNEVRGGSVSMPIMRSSPPVNPTGATDSGTDSETEPESEPEQLNEGARPTLIPRADQIYTGSFVLDPKTDMRVPASINTFLRAYQREGVQFFYDRWKEGRGGILGDDMGLGKTIQVISFLSAIMRKTATRADEGRRAAHVLSLQEEGASNRDLPPPNSTWPTCLIIAPKTVVGNWERELQTWGYFEVGVYNGARDARQRVLTNFRLGRLDIVLSSFTTVRNDIELLNDLPWSCIFVDEVHVLKNAASKITVAFNRFQCKVRFGLTGTALQNGYKEMWPLLDWSNPGRLGTASQWKTCIERPLMLGQARDCTEEQLARARLLATRFVERLLPIFWLRRTKALIKDQLPQKFDHVVFCPLTDIQIAVYKRFLETEDVQLMLRKDEPCECGKTNKGKLVGRGYCCHKLNRHGKPWSHLILVYMEILLKISNNVLLIFPGPSDTPEQIERNRALLKIAFPDADSAETTYGKALMKSSLCGKYQVLVKLLDQWRKEGGNKVLIFTKSVKLLEFLAHWLTHSGINLRTLDGKTPSDSRMRVVDEFNHDPSIFVFLISTMTGGTGLNLTAANKVVVFDPNWNPAHDLQAMDRAYRYGQTRDVSVYRLLAAGSLEELVYARQLYKQQQMRIGYEASVQTRYFLGVQGEKGKHGELFGVRNLFTLQDSAFLTKHTIERANLEQLVWALENVPTQLGGKTVAAPSSLEDLGDMMTNEDAPATKTEKSEKEDEIFAILSGTGVQYSHRNDVVLMETPVEGDIVDMAINASVFKCRKGKKRKRPQVSEEQPERGKKTSVPWPPKRRHHQKRMYTSAREMLNVRQQELLRCKYIQTLDQQELSRFAGEFIVKSEAERLEILARLDREFAARP
ncbi:hypothetical protein BOTBODRAFT_185328 [Botryobasidium botryosum FD-172 SS1]|uniref:DNA repair protein RAD26 n=1 Tax=Botryobasidium botryosum (strain FD-172 SS1) TaxID=930990 RepID=A0A067MQS3_BOTB1|nr:hypothetical protein BOTBODRAFT_185328 [Botryobasidium botryosum FD-172 SS1]